MVWCQVMTVRLAWGWRQLAARLVLSEGFVAGAQTAQEAWRTAIPVRGRQNGRLPPSMPAGHITQLAPELLGLGPQDWLLLRHVTTTPCAQACPTFAAQSHRQADRPSYASPQRPAPNPQSEND